MFGKPVLKFETARMPTLWWLRPVSSAARVGEHSGVTWKFVYRRPSAARRSMFGVSIVGAVAAEWREAEVVEEHDHVRRALDQAGARRADTASQLEIRATNASGQRPRRPKFPPGRSPGRRWRPPSGPHRTT